MLQCRVFFSLWFRNCNSLNALNCLFLRPHYSVNMMAVEVGHQFLNLSVDVFMNGESNGVIIDTGLTLAYLPEVIYSPLVRKVVCNDGWSVQSFWWPLN